MPPSPTNRTCRRRKDPKALGGFRVRRRAAIEERARPLSGADPEPPLEIGPDDPAAPASDVFSWGLVVLAAATGAELLDEDQEVLPFGLDEGDDPDTAIRRFQERFLRALDDGAVNLDAVPEDLRGSVAAALSPRESDRPTAERLLTVLSGSATHPELDPHEAVRAAMDEHRPETPSTLETRPGYRTPRQRTTRLPLLPAAIAIGIAARHPRDRTGEDSGNAGTVAVLSAQSSAHPHTPDSHRSATTTVQ
ncbi:hypothetical protein KIK06_01225 [Nocardiopsis sp. EMB25]|uniref:hypothetical protein n=1 Tax=Nocardiopsis TaxID=2013 RepID=UPI00034DD29B|nr:MULTISPECIES: hypothetical protein [Nocardiopsis]MCY9782508.1 hypothetical protein [Nocardiopsis sp. EMB25]